MKSLVEIALSQYGVSEVFGPQNNAQIAKYFEETNHKLTDESKDHWCGIFLCWCYLKAGYDMPNFEAATARNWLNIGQAVEPDDYKLGDIVVLYRNGIDSPFGHVGLFINTSQSLLYLLGGNQGDSVSVRSYPTNRLLGVRRV